MATPTPSAVAVLHRSDYHHPEYADDENRRVRIVTTRDTVKYGVREDGAIVLAATTANHYRGRARWDSAKMFSRWACDSVIHIAVKPGEPWRLSRFDTPNPARGVRGGWKREVLFAESRVTLPALLVDRARDLLPDGPSMWDYYPLLSHYLSRGEAARLAGQYGNVATAWAPAEIRRAFKHTTTAAELTRRLFGTTRYRRDLVKAVAQTSLPNLAFAWQLRGLVPVDWLIALMNERPVAPGRCLPNVRPHLRSLDLQSLRNLTRTDLDERSLRDLPRYEPLATAPRVHTWRELHDLLVEHAMLYRSAVTKDGKRRKPIRLPDWAAPLVGQTPSGLHIDLATHEDDLWGWAQQMRHCIGSYGHDMRSGRALLGAVRAGDDRILANFEIRVSLNRADPEAPPVLTLSQLLGHANRLLPDDLRTTVTDHLLTHQVVVPDDYWGARPVRGMVAA